MFRKEIIASMFRPYLPYHKAGKLEYVCARLDGTWLNIDPWYSWQLKKCEAKDKRLSEPNESSDEI